MYIAHILECKHCGLKIILTGIQYDDFNSGMMGPLNCPTCRKKLMPGVDKKHVKITQKRIRGRDPGWGVK
jgi:hypothetical protein